MYDIGDTYTKTVNVTDISGNPINSGAVTCTITLPDGSATSPTPSNPQVGTYTISFPIAAQAGQYLVSVVGTGSNAFADNDVFNVSTTPPGFIISLSEARKGLGMNTSNKVNDEDLREFISAATPIMEDLIGSVSTRTRVETFDGGGTQIALMYPPVKSVTTVIESAGSGYQRTLTAQDPFTGTGFDAYGYAADLTTGIITRLASGVAVSFIGGIRNVQVTYVSGRVLTFNQILATRRVVKFLWQSEQENYSPTSFSPEGIGTTPSGFEVPRIVLTLCADSQRTQGLA